MRSVSLKRTAALEQFCSVERQTIIIQVNVTRLGSYAKKNILNVFKRYIKRLTKTKVFAEKKKV